MLSKIQKTSLSTEVRERLLAYIENNHLTAGDKLPSESYLSEKLGVSRQIVREAMRKLEGESILNIQNGLGATITAADDATVLNSYFSRFLSTDDNAIFDLLEVRQCLEREAVKRMMRHPDSASIKALCDTVESMNLTRKNYLNYAKHDLEFHTIISNASNNPFLVFLMKPLRAVTEDSMLKGMRARKSDQELDSVIQIHMNLAQSIRIGAYEQALFHVNEHYSSAAEHLHAAQDSPREN